jgi:hypothetical protein
VRAQTRNGTGEFMDPRTSSLPAVRAEVFTGPDTAMQLSALDHLGEIAQEQREAQRQAGRHGNHSSRSTRRWWHPARAAERWQRIPLLRRVPLPLAAVLLVQAVASLRLVWSNTAFADEALYLWAGHLDWASWLDGAKISAQISKEALPTYFSGAPVIYPPLGALADSLGGLAGARLLSLAFMLAATCLLYACTRRLFDATAGAFAVALFVGVGSTQFLGAFATYDAMALFLLTLAAWAGLRAAQSTPRGAAAFLALSGAALALADATKYAAVLFNPVVIGVTVLALWKVSGRRAAWGTVTQLGTGAVLAGAGLLAGGPAYWAGIAMTTTSRAAGSEPMPGVLYVSGKWVGAVAFLAICGALAIAWSPDWRRRLLGCLLALAVFLAPVEQARIHTLVSLYKHVGYGAWFGCIVAGYALASLARVVPSAKVAAAIRVAFITMVAASVTGFWYSAAHFTVWPDSTQYVRALKPWLASAAQGQVLVDNPQIPEYYLRNANLTLISNFTLISNSSYFAYDDPDTGQRVADPPAAYAAAIKDRYFGVISLTDGYAPTVYDPGIIKDIDRYGGYQLVSSIPYHTPTDEGRFLTWVRIGPGQDQGNGH